MLARIRCRKMRAMIYIMARYRRYKKRYFLSQIIDRFRYNVRIIYCIDLSLSVVEWDRCLTLGSTWNGQQLPHQSLLILYLFLNYCMAGDSYVIDKDVVK